MFRYWHEPIPKMKRNRQYPTIYRCIYCGCNDNASALTTEHVIPEALGGRLKFFRASCDDCQRRIEKFEGRLINSTFEGARVLLKIKSKGSKPRDKLRLFRFDEAGNSGKVAYVDKSYHQGFLMLIGFGEPKFLTGKAPGGTQSLTLKTKSLRESALDRLDPNVATSIIVGLDVQLDLKRMLAKIAHSYWMAENPNLKLTPCLTEFIRGECEGAFDIFIGDSPNQAGEYDDLHHLDHGTVQQGVHTYGYVDIHLFSCFPVFHTYRVYVGSIGDHFMNFYFEGAKNSVSDAIKLSEKETITIG